MIREIKVRFVPASISETDCVGCSVVMVDVLRASTTIINALGNRAANVYPQAEIEASKQLANRLDGGALLGGERNGEIITGFHHGNSPLEYTTDVIAGKNLVLCTTNGTFTLEHCRAASRVLIGAFVNLSAVAQTVARQERLLIACAGTNRMVTDEDVLFAGAMVSHLLNDHPDLILDDAAKIAASRWQSIQPLLKSGTKLWEILAKSHGGRNLMRLNYQRDIEFCSQIDSVPLVAELDLQTWIISTSATE